MKKNSLVFKSLYATLIAVVFVVIISFVQKGKCSVGQTFLFGINFFVLYMILVYVFRKLGYKI